MTPQYRLLYFNARGRAEHIRFIFAHAGIEYEDVRVTREQWVELKGRMPFGALPVLEVDGRPVAQSAAIARFLARRVGLAGDDDWAAVQCDALVDALADLKQALFQWRTEENPKLKEARKRELLRDTLPFYLDRFEKIVADNGGFAVAGQLTWADFVFAVSLENFELMFGAGALGPYPALRSLKDRVFALPRIAAWVQRRPVTEF